MDIPTGIPVAELSGGIDIEYVYTKGLITSLYHLYGSVLDNFVDFYPTNNGSETVTLLVETEIVGYSTTASDTVDVPPNEQIELHQNPRLIPEAVDKLNSQQSGNFTIRITQLKEGEDDILLKESVEVLLYSRRDYVEVEGFNNQEGVELIAAWVTPTDPTVEELIRQAANYTSSGQIYSGYGGYVDDEAGWVWDRMEAIWKAEKDYNLTYISTMRAFSPHTIQRMRMPYEVLEQSSGNCIELATLCLRC